MSAQPVVKHRLRTEAACEALDISWDTLKRFAADSEDAGIAVPRQNRGTPARPLYFWDETRLEPWIDEVNRWRASRKVKAASGACGGAHSEDVPDSTPSAASGSPSSASGRSSRRTTGGKSGTRGVSALRLILRGPSEST